MLFTELDTIRIVQLEHFPWYLNVTTYGTTHKFQWKINILATRTVGLSYILEYFIQENCKAVTSAGSVVARPVLNCLFYFRRVVMFIS